MAAASVDHSTREIWLREILRASREVQRCELLLSKLASKCPFDWTDAAFQQMIVDRVLKDEQQVKFPPNRYQHAYFWRDLIGRIRSTIRDGTSLHEDLAAKEKLAIQVASESESEDLREGWYRNFELADICNADSTSRLDGPTESVIVLPSCPHERARCYPFRMETGCMAGSIGLVMWPAGFLLVEFALDNPELFRGKRVLELGAGIGLSPVFLAKFTRPSAIIATDFDPRALENIHRNFKTNGLADADSTFTCPPDDLDRASDQVSTYTSSSVVQLTDLTASSSTSDSIDSSSCSVHTALVDWYHYSPSQLSAFQADIIIAADTTNVEGILVPFAQTIHACLKANPKAEVYLAQAERHPTTFMLYLDALRDEGLTLKELSTASLNQRFNYDRTTCPVALHRVTL